VITLGAVPWRLIGAGLAIVALAGAVLWVGHRVRQSYTLEHQRDAALADLKTEREQNAANIGAIAQDIHESESERGALALRLDAIDKRFGNVLVTLPKPETLVQKKESPDAPCPRESIGPVAVELWNATATEAGSSEASTR
jgi:hypothetical protein